MIVGNPIFAVWFLGPNDKGLPDELIIKAINVNGMVSMDRVKNCDTFMFKDQIEAYCHIVHKHLKKFT